MTDFRALLSNLRRPRLLIRAAHCGMADYRRDRDLRRLVGYSAGTERCVPRLLAEEEKPVSYTHLDVYKRQARRCSWAAKLSASCGCSSSHR